MSDKPRRYTMKAAKPKELDSDLALPYRILLSCPKCGSEPVAKQSFGWLVICPKCGMKTKMHAIKQVAYAEWNDFPRKGEGVF